MSSYSNRNFLSVNHTRINNNQRSDSISAVSTLSSLSSSSSSMHSRGSTRNNRAHPTSPSFVSDYQSGNDYDSLRKIPSTSSRVPPNGYHYYEPSTESAASNGVYVSNGQYSSRNTFVESNFSLPPLPTTSSSSGRSQLRLNQCPEEEIKRYPIFPPTEEMQQRATNRLFEAESNPLKVLYAGDATYKPDKGILNKTRRSYFVLTHRYLLVYKSAQKAKAEIDVFEHRTAQPSNSKKSNNSIDKDHIFMNLSNIFAVHAVVTAVNTFRIDFLHPQSLQTMSHVLTVDTSKECTQWMQALREAISVYHISMETVSSGERHAAVDRVSKQKDIFDNTDDMKMYKVVFKEKRYKAASGDMPREFFLPVILVFGKFSFYLLPVTITDDEYLKAVERDRFGYLSIQSIRYEGLDDTVCIEVRQVNKQSRQLVFASTFCEDIVRYLYRSIDSIIQSPSSLSLFRFNVPDHIKKAHIMPFAIAPDPEDEITGHDDEEIQTFNIILRAYTAALNLNKARFNFTIVGPPKEKLFALQPPNEINESPSTYQKYELLALFKTIQANTFFQEVCFACHPLDSLESWKVEPNDGWTFHPNHPLNEENVLSNELYSLLTSTKSLRKLDLTDCCIGKQSFDGTLKRSSAIAIIGKTMQSGETNLSRLSLGKNKISRADFQELIEGIRRHRKSIKELYLHECGLEKDMIEMVLWTLMEKNPEQMISLDLSTDAQDIAINPNLVAKIIHTFRRLEILRMRGYDLLNLKYDFGLENSRLRELDISGSKLSTDTVARLCKWIQMTSFRTIEALHLVNCGLNGGYVYELLCSISRSGNRQMHLNLAENPVMKEVMHLPKLYSAIMQGEGPSSISFAGIEWDDSTLREFIDCLRDNQTITHLIFSDIKLREKEEISEDTVRMLTSFFERNMVIRELELNYKKSKLSRSPFNSSGTKSSFTNAVVRALYGLRHNSSLQYLDISGLNIGDAGALSLSRALKTNRVLQSIIIDDNSITIEGYRYLVKVIQESATQVIDMPIPRNDLRFQLRYLAYRVEELVISQNEAQFFLIHTVSGEKKRAKTHELEMIVQERKSCELALKSIHGVIGSLMIAIRKNTRHFIEQRNRDMEFQLQAQTAAQELATAQVRLQGRANSVDSFKLSTMGGRTDSGSRRGSLASSSTSSSVRGSRNNSGSYSHQQPSSHHPLVRGSTILNYDFYARSMSPPPSSNGYTSPSMNHVYLPRSKSETVGGKPHSFGSQLPPTPGEYYRPDFSDNSPLSPPLASAYSTSHVDDPGFIEDFGCVDDLGYVDGFELGPEPSYFQKPNASKADLDSIWDEDRVVDHLSRSLYLSSDARE